MTFSRKEDTCDTSAHYEGHSAHEDTTSSGLYYEEKAPAVSGFLIFAMAMMACVARVCTGAGVGTTGLRDGAFARNFVVAVGNSEAGQRPNI